jgi:hypothetical protein
VRKTNVAASNNTDRQPSDVRSVADIARFAIVGAARAGLFGSFRYPISLRLVP